MLDSAHCAGRSRDSRDPRPALPRGPPLDTPIAAATCPRTEDETLRRATDLLWRFGYRAVSVDQLVRGTGLNRHSLYARYGSKLGLLRAALERYVDQTVAQLETAFAHFGTPRERLEHLLSLRHPDVTDEFWRRMLRQGCFGFRTLAEMREEHPELEAIVGRIALTLRGRLTDLVREGQDCGEFRRDRPAEELAEVVASGFVSPLLLPPSDGHSRALLAVVA